MTLITDPTPYEAMQTDTMLTTQSTSAPTPDTSAAQHQRPMGVVKPTPMITPGKPQKLAPRAQRQAVLDRAAAAHKQKNNSADAEAMEARKKAGTETHRARMAKIVADYKAKQQAEAEDNAARQAANLQAQKQRQAAEAQFAQQAAAQGYFPMNTFDQRTQAVRQGGPMGRMRRTAP